MFVMWGNILLRKLKWDQNKCPLYGVLMSMEIHSGLSKLSIILQVSGVKWGSTVL